MEKETKILIVTNTFQKYHRQNIASDSWKHLQMLFPSHIELVNLQFADEQDTFQDYYEGIPTKFALSLSSKTFVPESHKKLPVLWEIIKEAFLHSDSEYVLYTNSDVILLPRLIECVISEQPDCMAGPRLDIADIDSFQKVLDEEITPVRCEIAGYDYFLFKRDWFEEYEKFFKHMFVIGKPIFDVDYAGLMVLLGKKCIISNGYPMMALHINHGTDAVTTDCPERDHNIKVHEDCEILCIANNIMFYNLQYNLCKRKPWGAFLYPEENEKIVQNTFFDCMNIHKENLIQYIQ